MMLNDMDRVNRILQNKAYRQNIEKNRMAEADRCFCHHDIGHFMDVARIARIISLEESIDIPTDIIYSAALLHDVGRHVQYADGTPHEVAGAQIAPEILRECGFSEKETEEITDAIRQHRNKAVIPERNLRGLLYRADKSSRACYGCPVEQECAWDVQKKNLKIQY